MESCNRVIQKLERLEKRRPDPSDHLVNIMNAIEGEDMDDEAWCNFYRYITIQDKDEWKFIAREQVVTLGDLDPEYIKSVEKMLEYPPEQTVKVWKNGVDIHISVDNVKTTDIIDKHEPLVGPFKSVPQSPSRRKFKKCDEKSKF